MTSGETFQRILVPLDGSRLAESVLPLVTQLAECLGATIYLLHVVEAHAPSAVHGQQHLTTAAQAEAYLRDVTARLGAGVPVEHHVHGPEAGDVATCIAEHSAELHADLIVLCVHGPVDLRRLVSGSIGQQVGRQAHVPVLLIRSGAPAPRPLTTLLVPLDGTPFAEAALPGAANIARACGVTCVLVRVVPTLSTLSGDRAAAARLVPLAASAALDVEEEQARAYLADWIDRLARDGVRARGEVRRGPTVRRLAEAAEAAPADMVVIATHGRTGLGAAWIGSVAAALAGATATPLLLLRRDNSEA